MSFSGTVTVPGYTVPSTQVCLLGWNPPVTKCKWGGWQNLKLKCKTTDGSTYWYDCWGTPTIEVFPELVLTGSVSSTIDFKLGAGVYISTSPTGTAYESSAFTIKNLSFYLTVAYTLDGDNISNNFTLTIPSELEFEQVNGDWSVTFPLDTFSYSIVEDGLKYDASITMNLVGCLTPEAPESWLNVQLVISLNCKDDGTTIYNTSFSLMCPIVDA